MFRPLILASLVAVQTLGCKSEPERAASVSQPVPSASAAQRATGKPRFVGWVRSELPLEQFVQREVEHAEADGARVLVYVGATWCEPCKHFHAAIERGELDRDLAGMRFLEFDLDRDGNELSAAGYRSKYIPLLAVPDPDGRASGRMLEGSIKGPQAVRDDLLPRLQKLLNAG